MRRCGKRIPVAVRIAACCLAACCAGEGRPADPADAATRAADAGGPGGPVIYSWVDDEGRIRMSERAEEIPADRRERVMATDTGRARADRLRSDRAIVLDLRRDGNRANYSAVDLCGLASRDEGPAAFADPAAAGRTLVRRAAQALCRALGVEPARPAARIVLYTTPWCGFCKRAAAYLRERGVAFEERDIEANRWAAVELERKMREAGLRGGGVPVIDIDGFLVVGFDRQRLDELLH